MLFTSILVWKKRRKIKISSFVLLLTALAWPHGCIADIRGFMTIIVYMLKMIVLYVCVLSGNELLSKLIATLNSLFSHFVVRTNPVTEYA